MNQTQIGLVVVGLLVVGGVYYFGTNHGAASVQVTKFYDGRDGYSVSIPGGNSSTCIWTYEGGSAAVPYSETTEARTATEKHTIHDDGYSNWKVTCVDDFGNNYVGIFSQ